MLKIIFSQADHGVEVKRAGCSCFSTGGNSEKDYISYKILIDYMLQWRV